MLRGLVHDRHGEKQTGMALEQWFRDKHPDLKAEGGGWRGREREKKWKETDRDRETKKTAPGMSF